MLGSMRRGIAVTIAPVLIAAGAVTALVIGGPSAGATEEFYQPPSPLPAGEAGDVIRSEPSTFSGARATRIMYLSQDINEEPMAVTGTVLVPDKPWNGPGPRPIVAYATPTVGAGDQCAPSKTMAGEGQASLLSVAHSLFINPLLDKGIAVAQTDYQGLGTPGDHTYMMREPQAHAVLDVIRAAQRLPGTGLPSDGPVGITGYSQGGGASAAAAELAASYAPELDVRGAYVGAPPADLAAVGASADGGYAGAVVGLAVYGARAAYPELDIDALLNDRGRQALDDAAELCLVDGVLRYPFLNTKDMTADGRPISEYLAEEPYSTVVEEQRIGNIAPTVPTLVEHTPTDDLVPYAQGKQMARDWCELGAEVQFRDVHTLPLLLSHVSAALPASGNSATWLADRFAERPATSNCGQF
ncbi:lipase family protein [Streptomyces sp. NBC_01803]|uniref:lipase family protein n=1 Tax=Streptomyces sp. NBC_01803 TaxID=2975946 RepID=UPI002DD842ED|nr:lipase family protein [Streptomyces sp. NBC_01803]WSA46306.1 lipase family protein [Streptomyces sp. NBC_01803]